LDYGLPEDNLSNELTCATAKVLNTRMSRITSIVAAQTVLADFVAVTTVAGDSITLGLTAASFLVSRTGDAG